MGKYRVLERSFIDNRLAEPGTVVELEFKDGGKPGWNLELVQDGAAPIVGSAPSAEADEAARVRRIAAMDAQVDTSGVLTLPYRVVSDPAIDASKLV